MSVPIVLRASAVITAQPNSVLVDLSHAHEIVTCEDNPGVRPTLAERARVRKRKFGQGGRQGAKLSALLGRRAWNADDARPDETDLRDAGGDEGEAHSRVVLQAPSAKNRGHGSPVWGRTDSRLYRHARALDARRTRFADFDGLLPLSIGTAGVDAATKTANRHRSADRGQNRRAHAASGVLAADGDGRAGWLGRHRTEAGNLRSARGLGHVGVELAEGPDADGIRESIAVARRVGAAEIACGDADAIRVGRA